MGPDGKPIEQEDYLCLWNEENQANIRKELEFQQQPSALQIWVAQENLWVYHTLLDVIKNTNDAAKATRPSNAAVRRIYMIQVGQPAAKLSRTKNRIYMPTPAAGAVPMEGAPAEVPLDGGGDPSAAPMEFSGESGLAALSSGQMSEAQQAGVLLGGRYIDATGKPIPFVGGGGEVAADPTVPAPAIDTTAFGKEYKRLPVRMVLEMDQRYLPQLIAECATQPLQVEAQEVRINVPDATAGEGGGSGSTYQSGSGGSMFPILTGVQEFPKDAHIVDVVVQGVIYIFNKPNLEILKVDGGTEPLAGAPAM